MLLAEAKPGEVDAPIWVIGAAAIVVTLAALATTFLLKPGMEASEEMQERDSKKWR